MTPDSQAALPPEALRDLYLELLERSLTHTLYAGADSAWFTSRNLIARQALGVLRKRLGIIPVRMLPKHQRLRTEGRDWPLFAQTMIGGVRLRNVRHCVETVVSEGVRGDLIETGVWRGGAAIFMRGVLKAHGIIDRTVWVADSFKGLPPPDAERYPADVEGYGKWHKLHHLAVSVEEVKDNFRRYGLLDDQVRFLEGWFRDTLHTVRDHDWALLRLDGDMYESTTDALTNLYPGLAPGGFVIVDDYSVEECRRAVDDFRRAEAITQPLEEIDWSGVYWRRPNEREVPPGGPKD